jgi:HEPN domain-containing protein
MKQSTHEWVKRAEEDFLAAIDLSRRKKRLLHNTVCFHCQQCAEKYLKARLEEAGLGIPKTHDLEAVLNLVIGVEPLWSAIRPALQDLTDFAVGFRYPGQEATRYDAKKALADAKLVRREARVSLGLPE